MQKNTSIVLFKIPSNFSAPSRVYVMGTATTLGYTVDATTPIQSNIESRIFEERQNQALDWIALAEEALPEARPMTSEERKSINAFFFSHFD